MVKKKGDIHFHVQNEQINLDHEIIFDSNKYVDSEFKLIKKDEFYNKLNTLINLIIVNINNSTLEHRSKRKKSTNSPRKLIQVQDTYPHYRKLDPTPHGYMNEPMSPDFYGQFGTRPGKSHGQLSSYHPQSRAVGGDSNQIQMEHLEGKGQDMRGQLSTYSTPAPSFDPLQQHLYRLLSSHSVTMYNMKRPSFGGQQAPMCFVPTINNSDGMRSQHRDAHHYSRMQPYRQPDHYRGTHPPSHPMYLNDGGSSSLPQAINNTFVPATMSIQQLNIQNLGHIGPPGELQPSAIHNYASAGDVPDHQEQQILSNDQQFSSLFDYLEALPPNLEDGVDNHHFIDDSLQNENNLIHTHTIFFSFFNISVINDYKTKIVFVFF